MIYSFQYFRVLMLTLAIFTHMRWFQPNNPVFNVLDGGNIAVTFFFVLSGFFQYIHINKVKIKNYPNFLENTFKSNKTRIILFYIYLLLAALYCIIIHRYSIADLIKYFIANVFLIPAFVQNFNNLMILNSWFFMVLIICILVSYFLHKVIQKYNTIFILIFLFAIHFA